MDMYDPPNPECPHENREWCQAVDCNEPSELHVTAMFHCGVFCKTHAIELINFSSTGRVTPEIMEVAS